MVGKDAQKLAEQYGLFDYEEQQVELFLTVEERSRAEVIEFIEMLIDSRQGDRKAFMEKQSKSGGGNRANY